MAGIRQVLTEGTGYNEVSSDEDRADIDVDSIRSFRATPTQVLQKGYLTSFSLSARSSFERFEYLPI